MPMPQLGVRQPVMRNRGAMVFTFPATRRTSTNGLSERSFPHTALSDFVRVLASSNQIGRHVDLLEWLQGKPFQTFMPHQAMIIAWGNFANGQINFDVVSPNATLRTQHLIEDGDKRIVALLQSVHATWVNGHRRPCVNTAPEMLLEHYMQGTVLDVRNHGRDVRCILAHAIHDARKHQDCLCAVLGNPDLDSPTAREAIQFLLPHIDVAQRRIRQFTLQRYQSPPSSWAGNRMDGSEDEDSSSTLSKREREILHWVSKGKTNIEIGLILNISNFTVKNHLQRTFKKLNVLNRAQAIACSKCAAVSL